MIQAEQHALFVKIALLHGWTLWEYGRDTSCKAVSPEQTPIWIKPAAHDPEQMVPVGCLCCTNLGVELMEWYHELKSYYASEAHRILGTPIYNLPVPPTSAAAPLAESPDWLPLNLPQ